jgi:glutaminase
MQCPIQASLAELHGRLAGMSRGALATYIPELANADPQWFGICLVTLDGVAYSVGDTEPMFTMQSISKPFVYATALADRGQQLLASKVGVEPSGDAFNSISLDPQTGAPLNPMINAGAIATTSLVAGDTTEAQWRRIESSIAAFVGREVRVDESVYRSESETGFRNRAIAWMLKNFGIIDGEPMATLENYFRQCSLLVSCRDLAYMAATLANGGVHPLTGQCALPSEHVERVLSVMATCGMYDYAGSWLYEVGMPAKSGVSGGIIAVVPGRFGIGIFSPLLDEKGNSVRGIAACKHLSRDFGLHVFAHTASPSMALGRVYTGAAAPSRRQPSPEVRAYLSEHARRIKYLCLHGLVAVDGAEYIIRRMRDMAPETHSFILDMHEAIGISESAARLLNQARLGFRDDGVAVVCSRVGDRRAIIGPLSKSARKADRGFLVFEDNDMAVEWCENRLVQELPAAPVAKRSLADSVLFRGVPEALLRQVEVTTTSQVYAQGEQILKHGQQGDGRVFFIESGHVSILVPLPSGAHQRIASLGPGMEFGEMALLGQTTRSALVYADTEVRCRILDAGDFARISDEAPLLKIAVLENLAGDLANRLRGANQWIAALA